MKGENPHLLNHRLILNNRKFYLVLIYISALLILYAIAQHVAGRDFYVKSYENETSAKLTILEQPYPKQTAPVVRRTAPKSNVAVKVVTYTTCEQYRPLLAMYDWNVETMMRICALESKGNPLAVNDTPRTGDYSVGLLQVNLYGNLAKSRPTEAELKIPEKNIAFSYKLFRSGGYRQWATY